MILSLKSDQLIEGMILEQDIMSNDGTKLLKTGYTLEKDDIFWIDNVFKGTEVLLDEPRLEAQTTITVDLIRRGVVMSMLNKTDVELMYVMLSALKESIGGYFSKLYPQLIDLRKADPITFEHSLHVTWYSLFMGMLLSLTEKDMSDLLQAAMLHDIGKTYIPSPILTKQGKLSEEEFSIIKKHSEYGESWSRQFTSARVSDMIRHHHEHLNGKGYPDGLKKEDIDRITHIITVVDIFDAVACRRVYREGMSIFDAYRLLYEESLIGKISEEYVFIFREAFNCLRGLSVIVDKNTTGILDEVVSPKLAVVWFENGATGIDLGRLDLPKGVRG